MSFNKLVFSGVQPTGNLHLGNYLGALKKFVALQSMSDCIYCVVDLHSLTAQLVHNDLEDQTRQITAAFLASGIDPKAHIVFNQSRVMQHAELAWIFNCVARIGWMNRMTQFKDKAGKDRENASLLFGTLLWRGHWGSDRPLLLRLPRLLLCAALMAGGLWLASGWLAPALTAEAPFLSQAAALALLVIGGMAIYFGLAFGTGGADIGMIRRNIRRGPKATEPPQGR